MTDIDEAVKLAQGCIDSGLLQDTWPATLARAVLALHAERERLNDGPRPCSGCSVMIGDSWCANCATSAERDQLRAALKGCVDRLAAMTAARDALADLAKQSDDIMSYCSDEVTKWSEVGK